MARANQNQSNDQDQAKTGIDTIRKLQLAGITFESVEGNDGATITLNADGADPITLQDDDIDNIVRLMASQQRRRARQNAVSMPDGRGRVTDEAHDARLKGNEDQRGEGNQGNSQSAGHGGRQGANKS